MMNGKMEYRKKALMGMMKKGPMGPGAVKKSMEPMIDDLDMMQENMEAKDMESSEQKMGAEYVQFMVTPKEKEMIVMMRKKMGGGHEHQMGMGEDSSEG